MCGNEKDRQVGWGEAGGKREETRKKTKSAGIQTHSKRSATIEPREAFGVRPYPGAFFFFVSLLLCPVRLCSSTRQENCFVLGRNDEVMLECLFMIQRPAAIKTNKPLLPLCALLAWVISAHTGQAALATWNFDTGADNTSAYAGAATYNANSYDHTLVSTPMPQLGVNNGGSGAGFSGTAFKGDVALTFIAQSGSGSSVNNSFFTLTLKSAVPLGVFSISYDAEAAKIGNSGFPTGTSSWSYSINGGSFVNGPTATVPEDGNFHGTTVTFSGLTINANDTIVFKDTLSGYASGNHNGASFDNIAVNGITAVPEPVHYALAAFGLIFVGIRASRFFLPRTRSKSE